MTCPVCAYPDMPYPPSDYNICPCCGTEFGNDDAIASVDELRARWIEHGAPWFYGVSPLGWDAVLQLIEGGYLKSASVSQISLERTNPTIFESEQQGRVESNSFEAEPMFAGVC
jgi:hypothetical protein